MSGDSDTDGATTQDISAVLTMSDDNSSNYTINFFSTSMGTQDLINLLSIKNQLTIKCSVFSLQNLN